MMKHPEPSRAPLAELVTSLSSPHAYARPVEAVEVLETPRSVLFLVGERAYKLKKPLVDLQRATADERRRHCEEEIRLNRRLSPGMYLGVLPVTRDEEARFAVNGRGATVDWVVEMVRLPRERRLDVLLERGAVEQGQLAKLAAVLVRFHDRAMTGPTVNRYGLPRAVAERMCASLERLERASAAHPEILPPLAQALLRQRAAAFVEEQRELLERRIAEWRIREGHGDLRWDNVCLMGDDVIVYGCIEHDRGLRCGDVAFDLALLAMDLDQGGHHRSASFLVRTYADLTSDPDLELLVSFYKLHHALLAAERELATASAGEPDIALARAERLVQLAVGYVLPVCWIVACSRDAASAGVAAYVASRLRATLLADEEALARGEAGASRARRRAAPPPPPPRARLARQDREEEPQTSLEDVIAAVNGGKSVVLDAAEEDSPTRFFDAAERQGVPCYLLSIEPVDGREAKPNGGADASKDLRAERVLRVSAELSPEETCRRVQERLLSDAVSSAR